MIIFIIVIFYSLRYYNLAKNDPPVLAFARLCCLKIQVVRFAKVTFDLLDSSQQGVPNAFQCRRWITVNIVRTQGRELAITIYAFEIQESLCLLALRLTFLTRISNLRRCNASAWASWLTLAAFTVTWTAVRQY